MHLFAVWADDAPGGLGYLVPDPGDVTQGLGDDQARVVCEFLELLSLGI